jgi:hypothetical protein
VTINLDPAPCVVTEIKEELILVVREPEKGRSLGTFEHSQS